MCGFVGVLHWDREPLPPSEFNLMVCQLKHRGPDEFCAVEPEEGVGLGHARLKVIDLSSLARQPMANEDHTIWLVYNGEVYNFRELRRELVALGYQFRSQSDTEVILRAYEEWGSEAIRRLDGMFALALWDARRRELVLARDRLGKKPLFYWTDGRCLVFGSEIKALLAHRHVPCEVNESTLPFLLALGYPPTGETCYRGIRQVPPASLLRFHEAEPNPQSETYWDIDFTPVTPVRKGITLPEAKERIRQLLTEAVRRRLVADVPLGAFLSGGVDSTIVVGLMARLIPDRPVKTFSIGFEGDPDFNETRYAKIAAERFRTEHTTFIVTPQSFGLLERLVWHHDQPFGDSSAIPTYLLSKLTRQHVTVALSGDGGDEVFAGYTRFVAACWTQKIPLVLRRGLAWLFGGLPSSSERSFISRARRFSGVAALPLPERYWRWISYFGSSKEGPLLHPSLEMWWKRSEDWSLLSRLLYLNFKEYLPNDLLVKMDRSSMAHGLEMRSPFLDTQLLEFAARLPDRYKVQGLRTKVLLRRAFSDLLPTAIQHRGKMGFGVPLGTWFRGSWRTSLQDLLGPRAARLYRYLEYPLVQQLMELHLSGREDAGHRLWLLLTLEVWLRQLAAPRNPGDEGEVLWLKQQETGIPHV